MDMTGCECPCDCERVGVWPIEVIDEARWFQVQLCWPCKMNHVTIAWGAPEERFFDWNQINFDLYQRKL